MYYKVCIHNVIAQQCQLRNGRQPSQWGIKESNYKAAKRENKGLLPIEQERLRPGKLGASDKI